MKESKGVYVTKRTMKQDFQRACGHENKMRMKQLLSSCEMKRYARATQEMGLQVDAKKDLGCTCRVACTRHLNERYFNAAEQIYAYHGLRSFTNTGVGSIRALQRKKVRKIYLPETIDRGVGGNELSSSFFLKTKCNCGSNYCAKETSSKCVGGLPDLSSLVVNVKLSPIVKCNCATTGSEMPRSSEEKNIEISTQGTYTEDKKYIATTTQVQMTPTVADAPGDPISIPNAAKEVKEMPKAPSKSRQRNKTLAAKAKAREEEKFSSDSLVQHIHDLECPSKMSRPSDDPVMENKIEREYRQIFATKSKSNQDKPSQDNRSTSLLRRRFEALRRGRKKEETRNTVELVSSNPTSLASHKDVSIVSSPPSLEARSFSRPSVPYKTAASPTYDRTSYRRSVTGKKDRDSVPSVEDDNELTQGVSGMFRLWGKKFNLDDQKKTAKTDDKTDRRRESMDEITGDTELPPTESKEVEKKTGGRKFSFFNKRSKDKTKSSYKNKKGVTANRCEVKNGLVLKMVGTSNPKRSGVAETKKQPEAISPANYDETLRKAWLKKFLTSAIDSRDSVKIRWNNATYTTSSSTVFELMDNVYKHTGIVIRSKSDITTHKPKKSHNKKVNFINQNIEAWMMPKTIPDRLMTIPIKIKSTSDKGDTKSIEVSLPDQKWSIDTAKTFSHKIELVLHSNNVVQLTNKVSSDFLRIDIPKGFFSDSTTGDEQDPHQCRTSDEEVYKIVEYETLKSNSDFTKKGNFDTGDHVSNEITVTVKVKDSQNVESKVLETVIKRPSTQRDVVTQGSDVYFPKRCDVISVGIITQRDVREMKPILNIEDDLSEDESEPTIYSPKKNCEFAQSYLQDYYRHLMPQGIDLFSWCIDDSNVRISCSEKNSTITLNHGDGSKSCPNIYEEFNAAAIEVATVTTEAATEAVVDGSSDMTLSSRFGANLDEIYNKSKIFFGKFSKERPEEQCETVDKDKETCNRFNTDKHKRVVPKDSVEVFRKRKIYAVSQKRSKWGSSSNSQGGSLPSLNCKKPGCKSVCKKRCCKSSSKKRKSNSKHVSVRQPCPSPPESENSCLREPPCPPRDPPCPYRDPPCPHKEPPCPPSEPPCPSSKPPCPHRDQPCPPKEPFCPRRQPPCPRRQPPCPHKETPCPPSEPPCPHRDPPCPLRDPPCPPKDPPCPLRDPPCPPRDPPCPHRDPRCPICEPPCPPSILSNPSSKPPCPPKDPPCPPRDPPCPSRDPPCPPRDPPCPHRDPPCPHRDPPCPPFEPPCPPRDPPCPPFEPPCPPRDPPCPHRDPPCPHRDPPCPLRDPPCPHRDPPCPICEPPCPPSILSNPSSKPPCLPSILSNPIKPPCPGDCPHSKPPCPPITPPCVACTLPCPPSDPPCSASLPHCQLKKSTCPSLVPRCSLNKRPSNPKFEIDKIIKIKCNNPAFPPRTSPPSLCSSDTPVCSNNPSKYNIIIRHCPTPPPPNVDPNMRSISSLFNSEQDICSQKVQNKKRSCPMGDCMESPKNKPLSGSLDCKNCMTPPCTDETDSSTSSGNEGTPCKSPCRCCLISPPAGLYQNDAPPSYQSHPPGSYPRANQPQLPSVPKTSLPIANRPPSPPSFLPEGSVLKKFISPPSFPLLHQFSAKTLTSQPSLTPDHLSTNRIASHPPDFTDSSDAKQSSSPGSIPAKRQYTADLDVDLTPRPSCRLCINQPISPSSSNQLASRPSSPPPDPDPDPDPVSPPSSLPKDLKFLPPNCQLAVNELASLACSLKSPDRVASHPSSPLNLPYTQQYNISDISLIRKSLAEKQSVSLSPFSPIPPVLKEPVDECSSPRRVESSNQTDTGAEYAPLNQSSSANMGMIISQLDNLSSQNAVADTNRSTPAGMSTSSKNDRRSCVMTPPLPSPKCSRNLKSKFTGLFLRKLPAMKKTNSRSGSDDGKHYNLKVNDYCSDSHSGIREMKLQDEDGLTLCERTEYKKRSRSIHIPSVGGDVYESANVCHRVSTNKSERKLNSNSKQCILPDDSSPSLANLVEIQFKMKVTQGDKMTEINIGNGGDSEKDKVTKEKPQSSRDVYVVNKTSEPVTVSNSPGDDIDIRIIIKNFKGKNKKATRKIKKKESVLDEFTRKISEKFHTVSTGYSDIAHSDADPTGEPSNAFSVHRATWDLTCASDDKEKSGKISRDLSDYTDKETTNINTNTSQSAISLAESGIKDDEIPEKPVGQEKSCISVNISVVKSDISKPEGEPNVVTDDTDQSTGVEIGIISSSDTTRREKTPKAEKKKMLKMVIEKAGKIKHKNKEKVTKITRMLKTILTSDSSDHADMTVIKNDLAKDITYASLPPSILRDTASMNNFFQISGMMSDNEDKCDRLNTSRDTVTSDVDDPSAAVDRTGADTCGGAGGACLCNKMATKLGVCGGRCCCQSTKREKADMETNCDMRTDEDMFLLNYGTSSFIDQETQRSRLFCSKANSINVTFFKSVLSNELDIFNVNEVKKFPSNNLEKSSQEEPKMIKKTSTPEQIDNVLHLSDEDKIIIANMEPTKYKIETIYTEVTHRKEPKQKMRLGNMTPADILQSYETKKAVLEMYTERTMSNGGERLVAKLPKFSLENESDIIKYEKICTRSLIFSVKR